MNAIVTRRPNLDLGVIGNCGIAALVDERARICWTCMIRSTIERLAKIGKA